MKSSFIHGAVAAACFAGASFSAAALSSTTGYEAVAYHSHLSPDSILSFDWAEDGDLYYSTASDAGRFGGLFQSNGGTTNVVAGDGGLFTGASVVVSGGYVYYNVSDESFNQHVYKYGPTGGGGASPVLISSTPSYAFTIHAGSLYLSGAVGWDANELWHGALDGSGNLGAPPVSLGTTPGYSGPLIFDAAGNLYYAPGGDDTGVYRWSAGEVLSAIAGGELSVAGHQVLDYGTMMGGGGATSIAVDEEGVILISWTNFEDPAALIAFRDDGTGAYSDGEVLLTSTGRLGEVRLRDGEIYLTEGDTIYRVVPEPGAVLLAGAGSLVLLSRRRKS